MRNLKKYLSMALAIAMMIMAVVPATFAANDYESQANALYTMGLYKGLSEDAFVPDLESTLDRQTGAVMLLRTFGVEEEALAMEEAEANEILAEKFSDADMVAPWAAKQVAYATEMGVINGFPGGTFRPTGLLNGRQYCTLVLKQLGYEVDYQKAGEQFADVAGLNWAEESAFGTDGAITKDVLVGISFVTLTSKLANEEKTLMDKLVAEEVVEATVAEEAGVFVPPSTTTEEAIGTTEEAVVVPEGAATEMTEVKVTGERTMVATFDGVVATGAAFTVTGPMTVNPTITWNETKTEATLTNNAMLLAGIYTVSVVAGDVEGEATVNVVANGIANIEILGDQLIRTSDDGANETGTGFFYVKLTDSYGNDVTASKAYDVTISFSKSTNGDLTIDADTGKVLVERAAADEWDNYPAVPEMVTVTIYSNTAVNGMIASTSKTLTVSEQARVKDITLGEVTFPGSATQMLTEKDPAAYVEIEALDQFGYEVTDEARLADDSEIVYSVSDSDVTVTPEEYTDEDGNTKARLVIATTNLTDGKKVTLSAISKYKGTVSNALSLDVRVPKAVEKVVLGAPENTMAVGDTYDDVLILPFDAYDADGNQLTVDEVISAANAGNITAAISGQNTITVEVAKTGDHKGKLVSTLDSTADAITGALDASQVTMTVDLAESTTMPTTTKLLTLKARAYPVSIELDDAPATKLLANATTSFNYKFIDQYGREMDSGMVEYDSSASGEYPVAVKLTATFPSGSDATFTVATNQDVDGSTVDVVANAVQGTSIAEGATTEEVMYVYAYDLDATDAVTFNAGAEDGTVRIKAELYKEYDLTSVIDSLTTSFTVEDGLPTDLTYSIEDVPVLYAYAEETAMDGNAVGATSPASLDATEFLLLTSAEAKYVREVKLVATDASGNTYAIPQANILSVQSSDTDVAHVLKITGDATIDDHDTTVVVFGTDTAFDAENLPASATKTATVTVVVATDDGALEVTKEVTVSNEASKAVEVLFTDDAQDAADPYSVEGDEITDLSDTVANLNATTIHAITLDQFGVYTDQGDVDLTIVNTNRYTNETTISMSSNTIADIEAGKILTDEKVYLMYTAPSGVSGQFSVTATDGVAALDTTVPTITSVSTADSDNDGKIEYTLTFSEAIDDSTLVVANFEVGGSDVVVDAGTDLTGTGTADDVTYVIETNAVDTDAMAIEYDGTALKDLAGNALAAVTVTDATDTVAPIIVSVTLGNEGTGAATDFEDNDILEFVFSEPVGTEAGTFATDATPTFAELNALFTFSEGALTDMVFDTTDDLSGADATSWSLQAAGDESVNVATTAGTITPKAAAAIQFSDASGNDLNTAVVNID